MGIIIIYKREQTRHVISGLDEIWTLARFSLDATEQRRGLIVETVGKKALDVEKLVIADILV